MTLNRQDRRIARFLRIRWSGRYYPGGPIVGIRDLPEREVFGCFGGSLFWALYRLNFAVRDLVRAIHKELPIWMS